MGSRPALTQRIPRLQRRAPGLRALRRRHQLRPLRRARRRAPLPRLRQPLLALLQAALTPRRSKAAPVGRAALCIPPGDLLATALLATVVPMVAIEVAVPVEVPAVAVEAVITQPHLVRAPPVVIAYVNAVIVTR